MRPPAEGTGADDQEHESRMIQHLMRNIQLESPAAEPIAAVQFPAALEVPGQPREAAWRPGKAQGPAGRVPRPLSADLMTAEAGAGAGGALQRAATPTAQTNAFNDSPNAPANGQQVHPSSTPAQAQAQAQGIVLLPRTNIPPHLQEQFTNTPPKGDTPNGRHTPTAADPSGPHAAGGYLGSFVQEEFVMHGPPPLPMGPHGLPMGPEEYMHFCKALHEGHFPPPMPPPYDPAMAEHLHMHGVPPFAMFPPHPHAHPHLFMPPHPPFPGHEFMGVPPGPAHACGVPGEPGRGALTGIWELGDLRGRVAEFSRDQEGSRFIQKQISLGLSDADRRMLFEEVLPEVLDLMTDVFGNYVVQKLIEHGSPEQMDGILAAFEGHVLDLSLQTYGCRVVQKALEAAQPAYQDMVVDELRRSVPRCVQDQNGNHVIQKCIETMPGRVAFIVEAFRGMVQHLATHAYGCRVIQRLLEHCNHLRDIHPILDEILVHAGMLVKDQYGNYVVQDLLIHGSPAYRLGVGKSLAGSLMELSRHKFASNVVEKLFQYGSAEGRYAMLSELMATPGPEQPSALLCMVRDQFANYVVQKLLDLSDDAQRMSIIDHIKPHSVMLRQYSYGKHIISRIDRFLGITPKYDDAAHGQCAHRCAPSTGPPF
eukprot:TRINITY_DN1529_c0_g2_i2.p1 TRINITY_DN1529_c0_g2~~TRINITY_DN1529_c0_g2_i2.p1  ORF type:complete len:650 (+),score=183.05 TRINITY_DN1529_c0_g2_i2:104-2053(+)